MEEQSLKSVSKNSNKNSQKKSLNINSENEEDYIDRRTRSRATSDPIGDPDRVWTTEELLADDDLWHVTDSSGTESEEEETKSPVLNLALVKEKSLAESSPKSPKKSPTSPKKEQDSP